MRLSDFNSVLTKLRNSVTGHLDHAPILFGHCLHLRRDALLPCCSGEVVLRISLPVAKLSNLGVLRMLVPTDIAFEALNFVSDFALLTFLFHLADVGL